MSDRPESFLPPSPEMHGFLHAIKSDPDNDDHRLVFADWLEEQGDPRGSLIRLQCEKQNLSEASPRHFDLRHEEKPLLRLYRQWLKDRSLVVSKVTIQKGLLTLRPFSHWNPAQLDALAQFEWWPWADSLDLSSCELDPALPPLSQPVKAIAEPLHLNLSKTVKHPGQFLQWLKVIQGARPVSLRLEENDLRTFDLQVLSYAEEISHLVSLNLGNNQADPKRLRQWYPLAT